MDKNLARAVLAELNERRKSQVPWLSTSFPQQTNFIQDPAPLKAALCTRRAGKSFGVGEYACMTAYQNPGVSVVILGKTRQSIKQIYWKDIMQVLNRRYNLRVKFNKSDLTMEFPNGSIIYLSGVDSDEDEMHKLLGQKFKLAILDESGSYNINQEELVYGILRPAVMDYKGQIAMIGTPTNYLNTLYHKITVGAEPGWSVHKWSVEDNPHMRAQWQSELADMLMRNPRIRETPMFKQFYLGEWVTDQEGRVYKYDPALNQTGELYRAAWQYVLGIDLGYEDKTTFVVCAYNSNDACLYVVHAEGRSKMILTDVADTVARLRSTYNIGRIVVDGAGKQGVQELIQRYGLPLESAEKTDKRDFIEIMNTDFVTGKIKLLPAARQLASEYETLIWDETEKAKGKWKEAAACDNHFADAALYAWRWCYNYASKPKAAPLSIEDQLEQAALAELENNKLEMQEQDPWSVFSNSTISTNSFDWLDETEWQR